MKPTPPPIEPELVDEWKKREPPPPESLIGALQDQIAPSSGPLISASPITPAKLAKNERRLEFIRRQDERIRSKATGIMSAAMLGADIDDEGVPVDPNTKRDARTGKPEGWTHRQYRIAQDARRPMKVAPGYLASAQRILESYKRAEIGDKPAPDLNAGIQVNVRQEFANYVTVNVTEREPK